MGQSLVKNYIHIIFSTKNREEFINPPYDKELYSYIGGICNNLECHVLKVGGHKDHVHILCMLSRKIALMELLKQIKQRSSKWIKTKDASLKNFYWQDGYGTFSVTPSDVNRVIDYIANQHKHHQDKPFKEEYTAFLKKYDVTYDEKYVWD